MTACVFDAYGTLFDVHSAVRRHADRLGAVGAAHAGLQTAWINRTGLEPDHLGQTADHQLLDLRGLVALLDGS